MLVPPTKIKKLVIAKGNSAASQNYWRPEDKFVLSNMKKCEGPTVILPDGDTLNATKQGKINISPHLSSAAQNATVLQNLNSSSLISLGQICDDKCTIVMNS